LKSKKTYQPTTVKSRNDRRLARRKCSGDDQVGADFMTIDHFVIGL
jgi:hypothetical protein